MTFGRRLRWWRQRRGMSLAILAKRCYVSKGYLSRVERDLRRPQRRVAELLDAALGADGELIAAWVGEDTTGAAPADASDGAPKRRLSGDAAVFGSVRGPWFDHGDDTGPVGVVSLDDEERLSYVLRAPHTLDRTVVDLLATVLAAQRRIEDRVGSAPLIESVRAQLSVIERLVIAARGPVRERMLDAGGQWAQFAGWLHASAGRPQEAGRYYERALQWGGEADNRHLIATALSMKGHLAWLSRMPGPLIGLSRAAQRDPAVSPGVRALAAQQEARGLALTGEADLMRRKLDEAAELAALAAGHPDEEPPWVYFFTPGYLTLQRGLAYRCLGRHREAIELLRGGLDALDPDTRHTEWTAGYVLQLAVAHHALGETDHACSSALQAVRIAERTASVRLRAQLLDLHARLERDQPRHPAVRELGDRLRSLAHAGQGRQTTFS